MMVLHRCDNPPCVAVDHLFLGTAQDNMDDKMLKGRQRNGVTSRPGETNSQAKLRAVDVAAIRQRLAAGEVQRRIAEQYGVTPAVITRIKQGKSWTR